jgi:hypothetical protein
MGISEAAGKMGPLGPGALDGVEEPCEKLSGIRYSPEEEDPQYRFEIWNPGTFRNLYRSGFDPLESRGIRGMHYSSGVPNPNR